jgi:hypothetical protein
MTGVDPPRLSSFEADSNSENATTTEKTPVEPQPKGQDTTNVAASHRETQRLVKEGGRLLICNSFAVGHHPRAPFGIRWKMRRSTTRTTCIHVAETSLSSLWVNRRVIPRRFQTPPRRAGPGTPRGALI